MKFNPIKLGKASRYLYRLANRRLRRLTRASLKNLNTELDFNEVLIASWGKPRARFHTQKITNA